MSYAGIQSSFPLLYTIIHCYTLLYTVIHCYTLLYTIIHTMKGIFLLLIVQLVSAREFVLPLTPTCINPYGGEATQKGFEWKQNSSPALSIYFYVAESVGPVKLTLNMLTDAPIALRLTHKQDTQQIENINASPDIQHISLGLFKLYSYSILLIQIINAGVGSALSLSFTGLFTKIETHSGSSLRLWHSLPTLPIRVLLCDLTVPIGHDSPSTEYIPIGFSGGFISLANSYRKSINLAVSRPLEGGAKSNPYLTITTLEYSWECNTTYNFKIEAEEAILAAYFKGGTVLEWRLLGTWHKSNIDSFYSQLITKHDKYHYAVRKAYYTHLRLQSADGIWHNLRTAYVTAQGDRRDTRVQLAQEGYFMESNSYIGRKMQVALGRSS